MRHPLQVKTVGNAVDIARVTINYDLLKVRDILSELFCLAVAVGKQLVEH